MEKESNNRLEIRKRIQEINASDYVLNAVDILDILIECEEELMDTGKNIIQHAN